MGVGGGTGDPLAYHHALAMMYSQSQPDWAWSMDVSTLVSYYILKILIFPAEDAARKRGGSRELRPASVLDLPLPPGLEPGGAAAHQPEAAQQHDRGPRDDREEVSLQDVSPG